MEVIDGKLLALIIVTALIAYVTRGWIMLHKINDNVCFVDDRLTGWYAFGYVALWPIVVFWCYMRGYNVK